MKKFLILFLILAVLSASFGCTLAQNTKDAPERKLYINEAVASNKLCHLDPLYGVRDWIELYNGSDTDISLKGMYISDNLNSSGKLYALPDVTVPAGGYCVLLCGSEEEEGLLPFQLSKNGETLSLVNSHREELCTVTVPALIRDVSYARRADGTYGYCALPTPGTANTGEITDILPEESLLQEEEEEEPVPVTYLPLKITAVQTNSREYYCEACSASMDTVVLTNPNSEPVNIEGYSLNDKENYVKKGALPSYTLAPGESITVLCCGENCALKAEHNCIDLGLSKNGDTLYLYNPNKELIDSVTVPALEKGTTYSLTGGEWVILPDASKQQEEESDVAPGKLTPGSSLCINELLYKNKYSVTDSYGDRSDFVELYNASDAPVSLKGWYLSDSGNRLDKWAFPDMTVQPGEYVVVHLSGRESTEYELHASFSVSKGETVWLYDSNNNLADSFYAYEVPSNVSIGRENGEFVMYGAPTPGYANGHPWPIESEK